MYHEPSLDIKQHSEVLSCLLNGDNIHEASGESDVGPHFVINLGRAELVLQYYLDLEPINKFSIQHWYTCCTTN